MTKTDQKQTVIIYTNAMGTVRQVFNNKQSAVLALRRSYRFGQWSLNEYNIPECPLYGISGQVHGCIGWLREHQVYNPHKS